jgi:L-seryl-tRNA(Ser) seleniumtransferase
MREVIDLAPGLTQGLASEALLEAAGGPLAARLGAPAVALAHGLAGAVILATSACSTNGGPVVLMKAHCIDLGGPLADLLALAGAVPVEVGSADRASLADVEAGLVAGAAAVLYVAEERLAGAPLPGLPAVRHAARSRAVSTIVVALTGRNIEGLLDAGADLLVLDAAAALGGPSLGLVAGDPALVAAARASQRTGLGRALRPTPDAVVALLDRLDAPADGGPDGGAMPAALHERRGRLADRLGHLPGLHLEPTPVGAVLHVEPATRGCSARDIAHALRHAGPAVLVDDRMAGADRLALDLVRATPEAFERALETIGRTLETKIPPAPWP